MIKKRCSKCEELKNISEFSNSKKSIDGKQSYCKKCNKKYQKIKHYIKDNTWKLYRLTINVRPLHSSQQKSYYIGITKKYLKDRLTQHISDIKNGCHINFWIMEMFNYIDLENINLRNYIKIELLKEYPSYLTYNSIKKIEKQAVFEQAKHCCEIDEWRTDILNLEHHQGNRKWKKDIENKRKNDIIRLEDLNLDNKKILQTDQSKSIY